MYGVQMDMFSALGERTESREEMLFRKAVQHGSGFEGGKERIKKAVREYGRDFEALCKAVRKEYGIGGFCGDSTWFDHDSRGFTVTDTESRYDDPEHGLWNCRKMYKYTWEQVVKKIIELIIMDEY